MILNTQPTNRWIDLIAEGIAALAREIGTGSMPAFDAIEWLAEWARDTRGDQRSLLLMTGHRAKGLEFDDVLLDGGWGAVSGRVCRKLANLRAPRPRFGRAMVQVATGNLSAATTAQATSIS